MDIRGERECRNCGTRWSYYETGAVHCPECGDLQSVGVDDRRTHTASPKSLDLTAVREAVDREPLRTVAESAADVCREYVSAVGFVHTGDLQPLDDTVLAAAELRRVSATVSRRLDLDDVEEHYFLDLLRTADRGERPGPTSVPDAFHAERGLAVARAVDMYVSDLRLVVDDPGEDVTRVLSALRARRKRIEALDGAVEPREAEWVVHTTRDLGDYLIEGDEGALATALERVEAVE